MAAIWLTKGGDLGFIPDKEYFELQLDAYDTEANPLKYSVIAGTLPTGLLMTSAGMIKGIPIITPTITNLNRVSTSKFTVRLTTQSGKVTDRTFSLTVAGLTAPVITPTSSSLGTYITGNFLDIQLNSTKPNSNLPVIFEVISGSLPPGITLSVDGKLSGYLEPIPNDQTVSLVGFDVTAFDMFLLDFQGTNTSKNFQFSVQASDGINLDLENYTIFVQSRSTLTADNDLLTADNSSTVTADNSNLSTPILLTDTGNLARIKPNDKFAYQLEAKDFDNDDVSFVVASGSLPSGITLIANTGWITGETTTSNIYDSDYSFNVQVYKTSDSEFISNTKTYEITVTGQISSSVNWITNSDLGIIYAGEVSELYVQALSNDNRKYNYKLAQSSVGGLPPGLELTINGLISGRPSFNGFSLDRNTTYFDEGDTTLDFIYEFTVIPYDINGVEFDSRTFTLKVVKRTVDPYQNLYIQILPNKEQRNYYDDIVNNTDIIPQEYLYRPTDLWFGRNTLRRSLFLYGLKPKDIASYISAMTLNHYWKTLRFGNLRTAIATDDSLNVKYEVVYIEILDSAVNDQGAGPNLSVTWPENDQGITTVYPNSFPNMNKRLIDNIGYEDQGVLPGWMTSRQSNGRVLGFTRALVLCYTLPGKSSEVLFRVNDKIDTFQLIDFTIDRYEWDNYLSEYYLTAPETGTGTISANTTSNIVLGSGTDFVSEIDIGKTLYVSNVAIGNVGSIISATNLTLTTNSVSNVTNQEFKYSTNNFTRNNFVNGTGTISANINSNVVVGLSGNVVCTGLITGNSGNTYITGTNTEFGSEITVGKNLIVANTAIGVVNRIFSNVSLRLQDPLVSSISNTVFSTQAVGTQFNVETRIGDTIIVNNSIIGTVKTINSNISLTLEANASANLANVAFQHLAADRYGGPSVGEEYLKFPQVTILA